MSDADPKTDDRRDSPRVPMTFLVRESARPDGEWEERSGDLSLGGIAWQGKTDAQGVDVDVRFRLPGVAKELRARGEIIRMKTSRAGLEFNLRFSELDTPTELAIAKYLDEWVAKLAR